MQALDGADEDGGTLYVLRDQEGGFISSAVDAARAAGPPARSEVESLPSVMGLDNERSTMNEETNGQVDWRPVDGVNYPYAGTQRGRSACPISAPNGTYSLSSNRCPQ